MRKGERRQLPTLSLRPNARQLSEATLVGYGIGNSASPMSVVSTGAFEEAGGHVVGTTGNGAGTSDGGTQTSVGQVPLGAGQIRIMGGGLPMPTETQDHRYGLKDYSLTYSGLYMLENSIVYDSPNLGNPPEPKAAGFDVGMLVALAALGAAGRLRRRRRRRRAARP